MEHPPLPGSAGEHPPALATGQQPMPSPFCLFTCCRRCARVIAVSPTPRSRMDPSSAHPCVWRSRGWQGLRALLWQAGGMAALWRGHMPRAGREGSSRSMAAPGAEPGNPAQSPWPEGLWLQTSWGIDSGPEKRPGSDPVPQDNSDAACSPKLGVSTVSRGSLSATFHSSRLLPNGMRGKGHNVWARLRTGACRLAIRDPSSPGKLTQSGLSSGPQPAMLSSGACTAFWGALLLARGPPAQRGP